MSITMFTSSAFYGSLPSAIKGVAQVAAPQVDQQQLEEVARDERPQETNSLLNINNNYSNKRGNHQMCSDAILLNTRNSLVTKIQYHT